MRKILSIALASAALATHAMAVPSTAGVPDSGNTCVLFSLGLLAIGLGYRKKHLQTVVAPKA